MRESGVGKMTDEVKLEGYTLGRALGEGAFAVCRIGHKNAQPDVQVLAVLERVWRCVSQRQHVAESSFWAVMTSCPLCSNPCAGGGQVAHARSSQL